MKNFIISIFLLVSLVLFSCHKNSSVTPLDNPFAKYQKSYFGYCIHEYFKVQWNGPSVFTHDSLIDTLILSKIYPDTFISNRATSPGFFYPSPLNSIYSDTLSWNSQPGPSLRNGDGTMILIFSQKILHIQGCTYFGNSDCNSCYYKFE